MGMKSRWIASACLAGLLVSLLSACDILGLGFPSELRGTWSDSYDEQYYRFDAFKMYYHSELYHNGEYAYDIVEFDKADRRFKERSSSGKVNAWYYEVDGDTLKLSSCASADYTGRPSTWSYWYR